MVFVAEEEAQPPYQAPPLPEADSEGEEGGEEGREGGDSAAGGAAAPEGDSNGGGANGNGSGGGEEEENGGGNGGGGSKRTRQQEAAMDAARDRAKKAKANKEQQAGWFELKVNTSIYVTGLPEVRGRGQGGRA
jgi:hypothetical protein